MPIYEYLCEANGRVVEVNHKMAEQLSTWGEVCQRAEIDPGKTSARAKVTKLMSAGYVSVSSSAPMCDGSPCGMGPCGSASCGLQ